MALGHRRRPGLARPSALRGGAGRDRGPQPERHRSAAWRLSAGTPAASAATPTRHRIPPDTTEMIGVVSAATTPDTTSPKRGPAVTTMLLSAPTRPRKR